MTELRHGLPYWLDRARPRRVPRFPRLGRTIQTEIAIVGGGITGAIAACVFAEAGIEVVLLEANRVGRGSTAASTALLMQEPDEDFSKLAGRYGRARARQTWKRLISATRGLSAAIRRLDIKCGLREESSIYYTLDREKVADLRREYQSRRAAGLPGAWLSRAELSRQSGIDGWAGILTPGNAQADPYRACLGFASAAIGRGAQVFEGTSASRVIAVKGGVEVRTPGGRVAAKTAIIATGYATPVFKPLAGRFRLLDTYVVATDPIDAELRERLPRGFMLWDTDRPYHYVRWTDDGRLLLGGGDTPHRSPRPGRRKLRERAAHLTDYLGRLFPSLAEARPAYYWDGLFAQTPDGLPYIGPHRRYPRHLFALGYGGNGMTAGFLAAQILLQRYLGRVDPDERLFGFGRLRS